MKQPLNILLLEDDANDAELVRLEIEQEGIACRLERVSDREGFIRCLDRGDVDLVLADFALPGFGGRAALELVRQRDAELPFIFVSGSMGEEMAVETLKSGATDYVLKEGLPRLVPAIRRALDEARIRREREAAERALRESEQRLELALKGADLGLWDWDLARGVAVVNRRWAEMLGYELAEIPADVDYWKQLLHPEDAAQVLPALAAHLEGETDVFEAEFRMRNKQGDWRWILNRGRVVQRDVGGQPLRATGTHLDITERRQAEQTNALLEAQLRQAQKMEALGTLAGGIAHDFNNILGAIIGYTELVKIDLPDTAQPNSDLGEVLKAATRAKSLVEQILTFSRQQAQDLQPLRLADVVQEAMQLLRSTIPATIELQIEIEPGTPLILGDSTQLHQIIMNLAANSAHALPESGGRISIRVLSTVVDDQKAGLNAELQPGPYAMLAVKDTGHGMNAVVRQRIFDPFFTTKPPGLGTGLGLAVVHGIVKKHLGAIEVLSEVGEGTDIRIYFPATNQERAEPESTVVGLVNGAGRRVLLVDDEEALAKVGRLMLKRMGFEVEMHTSSLDAWAAFSENPARYDLAVTDQTMPKLTGLELAGRMLKLRPNLPVILVTGYHASANRERVREAGVAELVMKPYTIDSLSQVIRRIIGVTD